MASDNDPVHPGGRSMLFIRGNAISLQEHVERPEKLGKIEVVSEWKNFLIISVGKRTQLWYKCVYG